MKKIKKRLGITSSESEDSKILRLWSDSRQQETVKAKKTPSLKEKLNKLAYDAGWHTPMQTILLGLAGFIVLAFLLTYLISENIFLGLTTVLVIVVVFMGYTNSRINRRSVLFEKQLVEGLGIAARSLRAGHPLSGSFQLISEEIGAPLGDIFHRICQEQSLGLDMKTSIRKVAEDTTNSELRLFATAVAIQLQSGGNLADLMDSLATVIRARIRLVRRVRVLTAQTNLSSKALIALPVILFFALNILNPEYMEPLYTTAIGKVIIAATASSVTFGWWVMKKMAVIRY
ncbi:MAG: type II secretion system F family protein [Planctomycetota bacterium]